MEGAEAAAEDRGLHASRTCTPSSSRTRTPTTSAARAASRKETGARADHAPRVLHVDGEGPEPAARAHRRRSEARSRSKRPRYAQSRSTSSPTSCRRSTTTPTSCTTTPTRPKRRRARGARSRRGARRNQGPPLKRKHDDPRACGCCSRRRSRRDACTTATRIQHRRPRLVRGAHARAHRRPPLPRGIPSRACCSPATTCCRRSRRTSSGVRQADSLKSYLATLDLVAQLDGVKLGLPAHGHPFADVPGRVEAIKEHHAERMEHAARRRRSRSVRRPSSSSRTRCSRSGTGARWPRARRSPTSSTW